MRPDVRSQRCIAQTPVLLGRISLERCCARGWANKARFLAESISCVARWNFDRDFDQGGNFPTFGLTRRFFARHTKT